jgi:hypothetical protein
MEWLIILVAESVTGLWTNALSAKEPEGRAEVFCREHANTVGARAICVLNTAQIARVERVGRNSILR